MELKEIQNKIESKFNGIRKDIALNIAQSINLFEDEEIQNNLIEKLNEDKINSYSSEVRKGIDSEISKAQKTFEKNLRAKFDFIEKNQNPTNEENKPINTENPTPTDIKKLIADAVKLATENLQNQVSTLQNQNLFNARKKQIEQIIGGANLISTYKNSILSNFEQKKFESDEDFNNYLENTQKEIQTYEQELANLGLKANSNPTYGNVNESGISDAVAKYINGGVDNIKGKEI